MSRLDMIFNGAEGAVDKNLTRVVAKIRRKLFLKDGTRISSALVAVIRRAANHPKYGVLIGPHCVSMVHTRDCAQVVCNDHFLGQRKKVHLPHFVSPSMSFKHVWVQPG
jgi:hypothetical protein